MRNRLAAALVAYAALSLIAWFVLKGNARYAVMILFLYFALRSVIAVKGGMVKSQNETPPPEVGSEAEHPER